MKKTIKILSFVSICIIALIFLAIILFNILTLNTKLDENKLINLNLKFNYYDNNGDIISEESNGIEITSINEMPSHLINAFVAIEDKRFYSHHGVDFKGLVRAFTNNVKSFTFKEGASTITQQLIKNTHLSSDKTIARKLKEIKLAKKIEKKYSKKQILEKYLNTIYFGEGCYGITSASHHYFNKKPSELSINESAILASIIKAPTNYSPIKNPLSNEKRKKIVLQKMQEQGFITIKELCDNLEKKCTLCNSSTKKYDYIYITKKLLEKYTDNNPYFNDCLSIYTSFDKNIQQIISKAINQDCYDCNKTIMVLDKNNSLVAYSSTIGDVKRQVGSTIKPLCVYAPSIENNLIYSCSKILDEKININGYKPSNYNDKYYGYVSIKESLAKSLNSCAVRLLNSLGTEKAIEYLKKLDFNVTENDKNLSLALGATENGQYLSTLASSYGSFRKGTYNTINCNITIKNNKNSVVFKEKSREKQIYTEETAELIKDMLLEAVKKGTAKKLSFLDFPVCAKTGTVGTKNGNTDAYCISFNEDYTIAVWYGSKNNENMSNEILGGSFPTVVSKYVWENIYKDKNAPKKINLSKLKTLNIDKTIYEKENKVVIADDNAPMLYTQKELFGLYIPKEKDTKFTSPNPQIPIFSANKNTFKLSLCQTELYYYEIYQEINGKKELVYTTKIGEKIYKSTLSPNMIYNYSLVPCYKNNEGKIFKGNEIFIKKIKSSLIDFNDDWWNE